MHTLDPQRIIDRAAAALLVATSAAFVVALALLALMALRAALHYGGTL